MECWVEEGRVEWSEQRGGGGMAGGRGGVAGIVERARTGEGNGKGRNGEGKIGSSKLHFGGGKCWERGGGGRSTTREEIVGAGGLTAWRGEARWKGKRRGRLENCVHTRWGGGVGGRGG